MKKPIALMGLSTALLLSGCGTTDGDGGLLSAINKFSELLDGTGPFIQESEEWEQYSIDKARQGLSYSTATAAEKQFVARKMDAEYPAAVDRLSRPFATSDRARQELDEANQGYRFTYNQVMVVKDKKTAKVLGYCVNYDVNRMEKGKPTPLDAPGNVQQHFVYVATDKPVSATTSGSDFIKRMCGDNFYNTYKNPNA